MVFDLGCAALEGDESIPKLLKQFKPMILFGFDPQEEPREFVHNGTRVVIDNRAAWIHSGTVRFAGQSFGARVVERGGREIECVDVTYLIAKQLDARPVVKLDCEGSEYPILDKLIAAGYDARLGGVLVEWHCTECGHGIWSHAASCDNMDAAEQLARDYENNLNCEVERWEF